MFKGKKKRKNRGEALTKEQLRSVVAWEIDAATDFVDSEISPKRLVAELYYKGGSSIPKLEGRSQVVVTKVRDAIQSIIPSVARIYTQTDLIAEFTSDDEEDEMICKDATIYCNRVFWRSGGYVTLIQSSINSLKSRIGVARVALSRVEVASHETTRLLTQEERDLIEQDENIEITEESEDEIGEDGIPRREVVMTRSVMRDKWSIACMPSEEFIIDDAATCLEDARMYGFRRVMRLYELNDLGIDPFDVDPDVDAGDTSGLSNERIARVGYDRDSDHPQEDKLAAEVLVCEVWLRIDADGDGIAELRHIVTTGLNYKVHVDEPVQHSGLAIFRSDLTPNVFFPISIAENLMQDQDSMTALLRGIIDNTALVNSPRTEANENMVNLEDLQSTEIGTIIRVKAMGQINELVTPFVAGQTLPVLQTLNEFSEARSGVTKMSQGVDPDALQSTSRAAANAITQNADARIEMMARNLGETGVRELFMAILRCAIYDKKGQVSIPQENGYKEVDTSMWHDQMSIGVNVGLGNGRIDEKQAIMGQFAGVQQANIAQYGIDNPISGYQQLRNTYKTMGRLAGVRNINDYFPAISNEALAAMEAKKQQQLAAQQPPPPPDPTAGLVEAEKIKGEVKMQVSTAELQQKGQIETAKIMQKGEIDKAKMETKLVYDLKKDKMDDDRERDIAAADFLVRSHEAEVSSAEKIALAKEQAKPRTTQ